MPPSFWPEGLRAMATELLTDRFADQIVGVLSCYDRLIIQGTIPDFCYA
jgi:hypothetical protein